MKKIISALLTLCIIGNTSAFARRRINQRAIEITPWLTNYHFQTEEDAKLGRDSGEDCQRVYSIGISPVNENYMLYSLDTNMVFKSHDGGKTWSNSDNGLMYWGAGSIVFHPSEEKTAFCVNSGPNDSDSTKKRMAGAKIGVYKTTDAGDSWTNVLNAEMHINYQYTDALLAFDGNEVLYALSNEAVYKSYSPYLEWEKIYEYDFGNAYTINVTDDGEKIVTSSAKGLIVSLDGGKTWQNKNIQGYDVPCVGSSIDPRDSSHWIASFGAHITSVFESFDNGNTWLGFNRLAKTLDNPPGKLNFGPIRADGSVWIYARNVVSPSYSYSSDEGKTWNRASWIDDYELMMPGDYGNVPQGFAVSKINPDNVFFSFGDCIFKSSDGGKTFKWSNSGATGMYPMYMKRDSEGKLWIGCADVCLINTVEAFDGTNYPPMNEVFNISRYVTAFDFDPNDPKHMIICFCKSYSGNLMESFDGGKTFKTIPNTATGQDVIIEYHAKNPEIIYTTSYISRDNGKTWIYNKYNGQTVQIHSVSHINPDIVWGSCQGRYICVSRDTGKTWNVIFDVKKLNPDAESNEIDYTIKKISADEGDENSAYFIANEGKMLKYGIVAKYDGHTIRVLRDPVGETGYKFALAQDPNNPMHLLLSTANPDHYYGKSNGVYESYNGGLTWDVIPGVPGTACVRDMMFDKDLNIVYMGGYIGFFIYSPEVYQKYKK